MIKQKKYSVWLADSKCNPIDGTDRILVGPSIKYIKSFLAHEENLPYNGRDALLRLPNGNIWCVHFLSYVKQ